MRSTTSGRGRSRSSPSTAVTPAPRHPPPQSGTRPLVATFDKSGGKRREEGQRREPHQRGPPRGFRGVVPLLSVGIQPRYRACDRQLLGGFDLLLGWFT